MPPDQPPASGGAVRGYFPSRERSLEVWRTAMSQGSIGAINVSGGTTALALSTSAALLNCWNTSAGINQDCSGGSVEVRPDKANNRVIVAGPATGATGTTYGNPPTATYK